MLYIATANSISTMGFNFEVFVYLEGLVKSSNSHKKLQQKTKCQWEAILGEYF